MALSAALIAGLGSCDFLEQTENTYQTTDYQFSCFENVKKVCSHVYSYLDVDTEWLWTTQSSATDDAVYAWKAMASEPIMTGPGVPATQSTTASLITLQA